jgi:effector-binding domain-containing protein
MMSCLRLAAPLALALVPALALALAAAPAPAETVQTPAPPSEQMPPAAPPNPDLEAPKPLQPGDAFGEAVTLPERTIIYLQGHSNWGSAVDTLVDSFKSLDQYLAKQGIKPDGPPMTIYTETDDSGFGFRVAVPVAQAPQNPPKGDIAVGQAPSGNALKFVHRGAYDAMDETYEAIINYLNDKGLEAKDVFVEEYPEGPLKQGDDKLIVNVFVPVK